MRAARHEWRSGGLESTGSEPRTEPRSLRLLKLAAWIVLGAATLSLLTRGGRHDWRTGDTIALVNGLPSISHCLGAGVLTNCNAHGGAVSAFALLQMIPAYVLHLMNVPSGTIIGALAWLNALVVVAFCAIVVRWAFMRAGVPFAVLTGLLLVPGMLLPYSAQSFGEPLATAAFGALCLAGLRRDRTSPWLFLLALAATISKDTAAPFVVLFGLAAITLSGCDLRRGRRSAAWLVAGTVVGLILATAFNLFRYDRLTNQAYLDFPHATKRMALSSFFGLLVSPNGGIIWFWPGVAVSLVVLVVVLLRGIRGASDPRRGRVGAAIALAAFIISVGVLALWWQPYGWYAWGPRLLMPVAPAVIILALVTQSERAAWRRWFSVPALTAIGVMGALALLPSIAIVFYWQAYTDQVIATWVRHPICQTATEGPGVPNKVTAQLNTEQCIRDMVWETDELPLFNAVSDASSNGGWYLATVAGSIAALAFWSGVGLAEARRDDDDAPMPGSNVTESTSGSARQPEILTPPA